MAGHALGAVSLHRIVHAVQVRGAAEQITHSAIKFIRDGAESEALQDMGFTLSCRLRSKRSFHASLSSTLPVTSSPWT